MHLTLLIYVKKGKPSKNEEPADDIGTMGFKSNLKMLLKHFNTDVLSFKDVNTLVLREK